MISEDVATTRARLRDLILRRQRGLPPADDELDVMVRIEGAFAALEEAMAAGNDPKRDRRESLEEMLSRLEDAAYDARNAADDVRRVLGTMRDKISRAA